MEKKERIFISYKRVDKQRLFAGKQVAYFRDQVKNPGIGDTHPMQTIKVAFTQEKDGEPITIGVATDGAPSATWFKIDTSAFSANNDSKT